MSFPRILLWVTMLIVAACSSPASKLPPLPAASLNPYRLDTGDRLRITVFGQEGLSNEYAVSDAGTISMPLLGPIPARGRTAKELEQVIKDELKAKQLESDASVSAQVERYRPFFVLGEVKSPGSYPYVPGMTLNTAVALAGGYTFRAEQEYAAITRTVDERVVEGRATSRTPVLPGDAIFVYESWF